MHDRAAAIAYEKFKDMLDNFDSLWHRILADKTLWPVYLFLCIMPAEYVIKRGYIRNSINRNFKGGLKTWFNFLNAFPGVSEWLNSRISSKQSERINDLEFSNELKEASSKLEKLYHLLDTTPLNKKAVDQAILEVQEMFHGYQISQNLEKLRKTISE